MEMQQYVTAQKDKNFTRAALAALQCKVQGAHAAKEAALCEAHQSKHAVQEASKHSICFCTHDSAHSCNFVHMIRHIYACASAILACPGFATDC